MARTELTPRQKAFREGIQSILDGTKHITTLTTGSILIVTTFLEKLLSNPASTQLVIWAISLLIVSIFLSMITMLLINWSMLDLVIDRNNQVFLYSYTAQIICFGAGIIFIAIFAGINLGK